MPRPAVEDAIVPFSRLSLLKGKAPEYLQALSGGLHRALVETFEVPRDDRFQAMHQHEPGELVFDRTYLGGPRSDDFVLIHITAERDQLDLFHALPGNLAPRDAAELSGCLQCRTDPQNGSSTRSPGRVKHSIKGSNAGTGFRVGCSLFPV